MSTNDVIEGRRGLKIGKTGAYVGFYGTTPAVQPSGANQAAIATTVVSTAATSTTPWGFATETQANNFMTIMNSTRTLCNQVRSDLVTLGIIKGSA